jgi:hypothetical protein
VTVGATQLIVAEESEVVTLTAVGAAGTVAGMIAADAADAELVPERFVAVTVNV